MTRLNIVVEGNTEKSFVKEVLAPYLAANGVFATARSVETSRRKAAKGGLVNYQKAKNDILRWLAQDKTSYVTSMFDYYGLPNDFPGLAAAKSSQDIYQQVSAIEGAFGADVGSDRFVPYIQLHEFEALLFCGPAAIDEWMELYDQSGQIAAVDGILSQFETPEHIDKGPTTAPSKRLKAIYPSYDKVFVGTSASKTIGIDNMRQACRHFREWLEKLLGL